MPECFCGSGSARRLFFRDLWVSGDELRPQDRVLRSHDIHGVIGRRAEGQCSHRRGTVCGARHGTDPERVSRTQSFCFCLNQGSLSHNHQRAILWKGDMPIKLPWKPEMKRKPRKVRRNMAVHSGGVRMEQRSLHRRWHLAEQEGPAGVGQRETERDGGEG